MKKLIALLLVASLLTLVGCGHWPDIRTGTSKGRVPTWTPTAEDLVAYLNDNAKRVPAIQCNTVQIDARQGFTGIGADGLLVFEKPRNFRLKARAVGKDAVDLGSNSDEFWYWMMDDPDRFVYHCKYTDLAQGNVPVPAFFQPDFLIAALGVQEYDPQGKYDVKVNRDTVDLITTITSPQGKAMQQVVTFNRAEAAPGKPQVQSIALRDGKTGKDMFLVQYHEVQLDPSTNAILPYRLKITMPQSKERMELTLRLRDLRVVNLGPQQRERLFSRADLMHNKPGFDMARGAPDSATGTSGLRPVGGIQPRR